MFLYVSLIFLLFWFSYFSYFNYLIFITVELKIWNFQTMYATPFVSHVTHGFSNETGLCTAMKYWPFVLLECSRELMFSTFYNRTRHTCSCTNTVNIRLKNIHVEQNPLSGADGLTGLGTWQWKKVGNDDFIYNEVIFLSSPFISRPSSFYQSINRE